VATCGGRRPDQDDTDLRAAVDRQEVVAGIGLLPTSSGSWSAPGSALPSAAAPVQPPQGSDVNRMLRQIASLERELRELTKRIETSSCDGTLKEPFS
jgi:hypothetical protein